MGDPNHPILQLEKWPEEESVRGVAGGALVPLVGAVALRIKLCKKDAHTGPDVNVRFKITASGSTDWVGMLVGAKVLTATLGVAGVMCRRLRVIGWKPIRS